MFQHVHPSLSSSSSCSICNACTELLTPQIYDSGRFVNQQILTFYVNAGCFVAHCRRSIPCRQNRLVQSTVCDCLSERRLRSPAYIRSATMRCSHKVAATFTLVITFFAQSFTQSLVSTYINVTDIPSKSTAPHSRAGNAAAIMLAAEAALHRHIYICTRACAYTSACPARHWP